jgi:small-conductance mechanosensitive channel
MHYFLKISLRVFRALPHYDKRMEFFGIRLVGFNTENAHKLLLTIGIILFVFFFKWVFRKIFNQIYSKNENRSLRFWTRQGLNLFSALVIIIAFLSIWFDDPTRLTTGLGLVTAGLAFALQKVVTSFAG